MCLSLTSELCCLYLAAGKLVIKVLRLVHGWLLTFLRLPATLPGWCRGRLALAFPGQLRVWGVQGGVVEAGSRHQ